jgi:hypothetical protein
MERYHWRRRNMFVVELPGDTYGNTRYGWWVLEVEGPDDLDLLTVTAPPEFHWPKITKWDCAPCAGPARKLAAGEWADLVASTDASDAKKKAARVMADAYAEA